MQVDTQETSTRVAARKPPLQFKRWFRATGWRHLIGVFMAVFAAFPLVYVLSAALHPGGTLITANALFSEVIVPIRSVLPYQAA